MKNALLIIVLISSTLFVEPVSSVEKPKDLSPKSYSDLTDQKTKMDFCIERMNNGEIRRGLKIEKLVNIFGGHLKVPERFSKGRKFCFLYFENQPENEDPLFSAGFIGWYACFEIAENGKLLNYWLSNLHK